MQVHVSDSIDVHHYSLAISTSLKLQIQAGKHFNHRIGTPPNLIEFGINTYRNFWKLNQNLFTNTKSPIGCTTVEIVLSMPSGVLQVVAHLLKRKSDLGKSIGDVVITVGIPSNKSMVTWESEDRSRKRKEDS